MYIPQFDPNRRLKVILDMDPGIDDALALLLALCSPELEVVAITTVAGNAPAHMTATNALRVLEYLAVTDIAVARGAEQPIVRPLVHALDHHGPDGLAQCGLPPPSLPLHGTPAAELLARIVLDAPHQITLIATGPLTNVAIALRQWPELSKAIASLVLMGGAYGITRYGKGNQTPVAEFNIWQDPEAAQVVFSSGIDIIAVGLDVTTDPTACMALQHVEQLRRGQTRAARLAARLAEYSVVRYTRCELHDPLALAVLLDVSLFQLRPALVDIITESGPERGRTRVRSLETTRESSRIRIAVGVDGPRFLELFISRLLEARYG